MSNQDFDEICVNCKEPLGNHSANTEKCPAPNRKTMTVNWLKTKFCSAASPFLILPEEREAVIRALEAFVFETDSITEKFGPIINPIIDRFIDPKNQ